MSKYELMYYIKGYLSNEFKSTVYISIENEWEYRITVGSDPFSVDLNIDRFIACCPELLNDVLITLIGSIYRNRLRVAVYGTYQED